MLTGQGIIGKSSVIFRNIFIQFQKIKMVSSRAFKTAILCRLDLLPNCSSLELTLSKQIIDSPTTSQDEKAEQGSSLQN